MYDHCTDLLRVANRSSNVYREIVCSGLVPLLRPTRVSLSKQMTVSWDPTPIIHNQSLMKDASQPKISYCQICIFLKNASKLWNKKNYKSWQEKTKHIAHEQTVDPRKLNLKTRLQCRWKQVAVYFYLSQTPQQFTIRIVAFPNFPRLMSFSRPRKCYC